MASMIHALLENLISAMLKHFFMAQLAAGFAAKGPLILMTSSSVATGLTHLMLNIWPGQMLTRRAAFRDIKTYLSCIFYMSWFVASDQLSLLWRRHKFKANLQCTDEAQNKTETRVYT